MSRRVPKMGARLAEATKRGNNVTSLRGKSSMHSPKNTTGRKSIKSNRPSWRSTP
jgi:hypothetical protein